MLVAMKGFIRFQIPAQFADSNASTKDGSSGRSDFQSRPGHGKWQAVNHHRDQGFDSDTFNDCADWNKASYTPDFLAELGEPLPEAPNGYRAAAIYHLQLMFAVDEFLTASPDARVAVVAVAVVLGWPSARGLSVGNIADQLGCSPSTLTRSIARFKTMAGLGVSGPPSRVQRRTT